MMNMENRGEARGLPERIRQAYVRRHDIDGDGSRRWHAKARIALMILICVFVGSMIIYWFVSSIVENRRDAKSHKPAYLVRLPDHVLPLEYNLKVLPILEEENFTTYGDVQIQFYSKIPTKHIRFHARELLIRDIVVKEHRSTNASKLIHKYVATDEDFIDVFLLQMLMAGEIYVLQVKYTIPLHRKPKGLFRSAHVDHDTNETKWIAVSNFSPDFARTAYPCFDEPWIKTPFRISIGRRSGMRSHSNSKRKITEEIRDMPGYVWDHYEKTLPMPTYVVAFMVTDFSSYDIDVADRPSHTIFSRKEVANDTRYIGNLIPKMLRLIQNYTGFYYELDKLDVIVVPELSYNAMENWGLITFREDIVTANDRIDSKREAINIAAHEVAHQWFGNLVTPRWWDDVWLKEGFSSFFGYLALSVLEPASWDLQASFLIEYDYLFQDDADETAHPLHIDLRELRGLLAIFDLTSYVKGNCMAHMIYHFLGERLFLSSIRRYMHTYYYRSADQEDLWSAFQVEIDGGNDRLPASSGPLMKDVMRTWTYQAGFPVLRVRQNRAIGVIELMQDRFYHYGLNSTSEELWHIPLTWTTENEQQFGNTLPKAWMIKKRMKINDTALSWASSNNQWILFNINQTGLYRVNYDVDNWKLLTRSFRNLPEVTKAQLLSDSSAMTDAGLLDKRIRWNIIEKLEAESDEMVWKSAMYSLITVKDHFEESEVFQFVMCKLMNVAYDKAARSLVHTNPALWTRFKMEVMKWACSVGHRACLTTARNLAREMLRNESSGSVPEEFRSWTYCTFVRAATDEQWLALLKRYNESTTVHDKPSLAFALGCHVNAELLQRYLLIVFSQKNLTDAHAEKALTSVMSNPRGYRVARDFIAQRRSKFNAKSVGKDGDCWNVTLTDTLRAFTRRIRQEEDVEWLRELKDGSDKRAIEYLIKRGRTIVAWYKEHKNETTEILAEISARHAETSNCRRGPGLK